LEEASTVGVVAAARVARARAARQARVMAEVRGEVMEVMTAVATMAMGTQVAAAAGVTVEEGEVREGVEGGVMVRKAVVMVWVAKAVVKVRAGLEKVAVAAQEEACREKAMLAVPVVREEEGKV
jgi:hypothetical protein